jgi:hypothetical protein
MELKFLDVIKCPDCGCDVIVSETVERDRHSDKMQYRKHSCGGRWETRTFACGCRVEYVPNFEKTIISNGYRCYESKQYKDKLKTEQDLYDKILNFIEGCDGEERIKQSIYDDVKSKRPSGYRWA